jgi:pyrroloquinoline quinone biosynthesis protein B
VAVSLLGRLLPLILAAGCQAPRPDTPAEPYVLVLGTAQDGGLPQLGCREPRCAAARADPSRRRLVTSLLLADPRSGSRWLFDASPDIREELELARPHPPTRVEHGARPPLVDGVFLTHAHIGHYLGLAELGREVYGARDVPVWASPRMRDFLAHNGPWSLLVETHAIELRDMPLAGEVELAPGIHVSALVVPHRDEFSDTLAFVIRGPHRSLLYLPDIDKWERWDLRLEDVLERVDVALVDGTFFADGELPGRSMAEVPHPFVVETLERLSDAPAALRCKVVFTHLNHTNPACDAGSSAQARIESAGMRVAREGEIVEL